MSISIYTYTNPYRLQDEKFFNSIKNCFHLCASQTLVNGLKSEYKDFYIGKLTTFRNFLDVLYDGWNESRTVIRQRAAIDNVINSFDFSKYCDDSLDEESLRKALRMNRTALCESVRTLFELGVERSEAVPAELSIEQKCMFDIYEELQRNGNTAFRLPSNFAEADIDQAIDKSIRKAVERSHDKAAKEVKIEDIRKDSVVIHGIHQFTPLMLRAIEELSKYKIVVILFNYVPGFKNVYQTWLNVYNYFESAKNQSTFDYSFKDVVTPGREVANGIKSLLEQDASIVMDPDKRIIITEFDNPTEFAGYVARHYELAEKAQKDDQYRHASTLYYMDEQIYSADSSVNEILKIYFPQQFHERQFLDYPIGHFFIAITEMWDAETGGLRITDMDVVKECLASGILRESSPGTLLSVFLKAESFINNEKTLTGIIKKLKALKKTKDDTDFEYGLTTQEAGRIQYFTLSDDEIDLLVNGLNELNKIADYFFDDFNDEDNDFNSFYQKISSLLLDILDSEELDDQFRDIIGRVLNQLKEVDDIDASASFDCLKETMQLYLQQLPLDGRGAHWIVRNFEQIDGDVLRSNTSLRSRTYHYACLSDADMNEDRNIYPWPLDQAFFETALDPIDWKYRVFMSAKQEYKNFRRYALVYALLFGNGDIKLSYIKNKNDETEELYYVFRILNAKVEPYVPEYRRARSKDGSEIRFGHEYEPAVFDQYDFYRYSICPARFLLETIALDETVYRDEFMISQYIKVVLEKHIREKFGGKVYARGAMLNTLNKEVNQIGEALPFLTLGEKLDITSAVLERLEKSRSGSKLKPLSASEKYRFELREIFLKDLVKKKDGSNIFEVVSQSEINTVLNSETLYKENYHPLVNDSCDTCPEKRFCLLPYKYKMK